MAFEGNKHPLPTIQMSSQVCKIVDVGEGKKEWNWSKVNKTSVFISRKLLIFTAFLSSPLLLQYHFALIFFTFHPMLFKCIKYLRISVCVCVCVCVRERMHIFARIDDYGCQISRSTFQKILDWAHTHTRAHTHKITHTLSHSLSYTHTHTHTRF